MGSAERQGGWDGEEGRPQSLVWFKCFEYISPKSCAFDVVLSTAGSDESSLHPEGITLLNDATAEHGFLTKTMVLIPPLSLLFLLLFSLPP